MYRMFSEALCMRGRRPLVGALANNSSGRTGIDWVWEGSGEGRSVDYKFCKLGRHKTALSLLINCYCSLQLFDVSEKLLILFNT